MKPSILNLMTWQDIKEICTEAHLMSTIPETEVEYYTPEAYYTELLKRLRKRNAECIYGYTDTEKAKACKYCSVKCDAAKTKN